MGNQLLNASKGVDFAAVVTASGGPFTGSEGLAAVVWAGQDQAPLATPAAAWFNHAAGTIALSLASSALAAIEPARYRIRVDRSDGSASLWDGFLELDAGPGASSSLSTYCSFEDLTDRASWVEKLQAKTDLAGAMRQRYLARRWFEDLLHRHYRNGAGMIQDYAFVPGISFGGAYGPGLLWRDGRRSAELQAWLDAGRLDVTEQVKDACACYAIALLCDRQVSPGKDDNGYAGAARKYFARAEAIAADITAEVDSDGDGTNDLVIRLGSYDTLEG